MATNAIVPKAFTAFLFLLYICFYTQLAFAESQSVSKGATQKTIAPKSESKTKLPQQNTAGTSSTQNTNIQKINAKTNNLQVSSPKKIIPQNPQLNFLAPVSLKDVPLVAKLIKSSSELVTTVGSKPTALLTIPANTTVYILDTVENDANKEWNLIVSPAGYYGWLPSSTLKLQAPITQDALVQLNAARLNNKTAEQLPIELKKALQAIYAAEIHKAPIELLVNENNEFKAEVIAKKSELVLPVLLDRHMTQFDFGADEYEYYDDSSSKELTNQIQLFLAKLAPSANDQALMQNAICSHFALDDSKSYGFNLHVFDVEEKSQKAYAEGATEYTLNLLETLYPKGKPSTCALTAVKKIAAVNTLNYVNSVDHAARLLAIWLQNEDWQSYLQKLAKNEQSANETNFAYLLMLMPKLDITPYQTILTQMAEGDFVTQDNSQSLPNQKLALHLLRRLPPSDTLQNVALKVLTSELENTKDHDNRGVSTQAALLLTHQTMSADALKLLLNIAKTDADVIRLKQIALARLTQPDVYPQMRSRLASLSQNKDPYVSSLIFNANRVELMKAIDKADTPSKKSTLRSDYLLNIKKSSQPLMYDQPLIDNPSTSIKTNPIWMIKPNSKITIQVDSNLLIAEDWNLSVISPNEITPHYFGLNDLNSIKQQYDDEFTTRQNDAFNIFKHQVLVKYQTDDKRKKKSIITIFADQLLADGQKVIDLESAGIYQFNLNEVTGNAQEPVENQRENGNTITLFFYCEPNEAFWSE